MWKDCVWNPSTYNCENGKYLASILDDSVIICDEIIYAEEKTLNEKNITCKTQNFYILLTFLLITITLLIGVSIYCYLIISNKTFITIWWNEKLKQIHIDNINWKLITTLKI